MVPIDVKAGDIQMEKIEYEKPSLQNINDVSYGDCTVGTAFAVVCLLPGSVAGGDCGVGTVVTGACIAGPVVGA